MSQPAPVLRFWLVTLAAMLAAGLTFSLGQWQLRRADYKITLQAAIDKQKLRPAVDEHVLAATENIADLLHRQARLQGVWQDTHTVYLDNRSMSGKSGFWVITPLALQGSGRWLLVQRGWVPRDFTNRARLPVVTTPAGVVTVIGRMAPPPSKLYEFVGEPVGRIRQNLDVSSFSAEIGRALLPLALLQTGVPGDGLQRDWVAPVTGVDKHYGYAFQWFALCVLVFALYVWFQLILPRRKSRHSSSS